MFIVKVPGINGLGKTKGCERAGEAMIKELRNINTNESGNDINVDELDLEEIHLDNSNLSITNKLIYENAIQIFETKPKTIFLGGDHSISYSITKAFADFCKDSGKEPCLIIFDAHPNCMPCGKFPSNREWLKGLIEYGFPTKNILLVGIRNSDSKENSFLKENKIRTISINSLMEDLHETCDTIMEFSNNKELYLSININVVDPIFAPSTAYLETGGLTSRQFLYLIQRMNKIKNLKAIDIVEINEKEDKSMGNVTIKLGAKILSELI